MKKAVILLVTIVSFLGCKNDKKTTYSEDDLTLLKGDFILFDDAAILQTPTEIYGVYITDKTKELNAKAKEYKTQKEDMVYVEVKGIISTKDHDKIKWPNKLEIIEIIKVNKANTTNNSIKLGQ